MRQRKCTWILRCARLAGVVGFVFLLCSCTTFNDRVREAQNKIGRSLEELGYGPVDVVNFRKIPRTMKGRTWDERQVMFRDHEDRSWNELFKYFKYDADYDHEECDLSVGESETDLETIRWFEFKIERVFSVYRVGFIRAGKHGSTPRTKRRPYGDKRSNEGALGAF